MFRFFTKKQKEECFICCSDAKTEKEQYIEKMTNQKSMDYPLLSMSYVYGCKCVNYHAHNKCLLNINKCPTCRKDAIPILYKFTKYDYYLKFLLNWLKKDPSNFIRLNWYMMYCLLLIFGLLFCCAMNEDKINKIIKPKSKASLCVSIVISISFGIPLFMLTSFNDYIKKYWLYNSNTKKYDAFHDTNEFENNIAELRTIIIRQEIQLLLRDTVIAQQRERINELNHLLNNS